MPVYFSYLKKLLEYYVPSNNQTFCWTMIDVLPKGVHTGLKNTLTNKIIKTKIDTILLMGTSL